MILCFVRHDYALRTCGGLTLAKDLLSPSQIAGLNNLKRKRNSVDVSDLLQRGSSPDAELWSEHTRGKLFRHSGLYIARSFRKIGIEL